MPRKLQIVAFHEVSEPVISPVTKFGGSPVWLDKPQWPISPALGQPMRFVCQIRLDSAVFGGTDERMAYVFYTEGRGERGEYVCGGWPGDGESAVIVQPGGIVVHRVEPLRDGPSLYKMVPQAGQPRLVARAAEYAVELEPGEDPDFVPEGRRYGWETMPPGPRWNEEQNRQYDTAVRGNKIGGTPAFVQGDQFPEGDRWMLLLQLEGATPFEMNFGDAGAGYAWIDRTLLEGTFFSQGC